MAWSEKECISFEKYSETRERVNVLIFSLSLIVRRINIVRTKRSKDKILNLQNKFTIHKLFFREKETSTCFEMPLLLHIFDFAFIEYWFYKIEVQRNLHKAL